MGAVYSGNMELFDKMRGVVRDTTEEIEDNTDAVEEQAETYEMSH